MSCTIPSTARSVVLSDSTRAFSLSDFCQGRSESAMLRGIRAIPILAVQRIAASSDDYSSQLPCSTSFVIIAREAGNLRKPNALPALTGAGRARVASSTDCMTNALE